MTRITVLGSSGGYPTAGKPCSGFLIEHDGFSVVLDLGYGALAPLLDRLPDADPDAVVITHEHPDHCADLHPLARMHRLGDRRSAPIPLYAPPGVLDRIDALEPDEPASAGFLVHDLPGSCTVGPFRLTSIPLPHWVPNVGIRLVASSATIAYTGDTGPDPRLEELGRDADVFIVEATDHPDEASARDRNLMTAVEAGEWAARARASRLLLTHLWPGTDPDTSAAEARTRFAGEVIVAGPGVEIDL